MGGTWASVKEKINKLNPWMMTEDEPTEPIEADPLPLRILERKDWGAKKPKWRQRLKTPVELYTLRYYSDTPECEEDEECFPILQELQEKHQKEGLPDIAYNFLVGLDGTVYEGRGWTNKSTKMDYESLKYHGKTIDIALLGDYKTIYAPEPMQQAVCRLMQRGVDMGYAPQDYDLYEIRDDTPKNSVWSRDEVEAADTDEKIFDDDPVYAPDRMHDAVCSLMQQGMDLGYVPQGTDVYEIRDDVPKNSVWSRDLVEAKDMDEKIFDDDGGQEGPQPGDLLKDGSVEKKIEQRY